MSVRKFILSAIGLVLAFSISAQKENADVIAKGDQMPDFKLKSAVYGNVDSKDLKGKVVLITIFATWCGPCQKELKEVKEVLYPKYQNNPNFRMLTVGREHTDEELTKYNAKKGFTFPLYPDPKRDFTSKFAKSLIPRTYLVDQSGEVVYTTSGFSESAFEELLKNIDLLLEK